MNKIILKEAENTTVNDEQLMGLYDAAAKTEGQIINLAVAAMKFSNPDIKRAVTALKSQANELVNLIATSMENNNGADLGLQTPGQPATGAGMGGATATTPGQIEAPAAAEDMIETTLTNGSAMNIMEAKAKAVAFFMQKKFSLKEAIELAEKFDPSIFDKNKKDDKEDGEEEKEEITEEIDLTEECAAAKDGVSLTEFAGFKSSMVEALNKKKFGKKYDLVVEAIGSAENINALNEALSGLYDFADENNIKIKA